MKLIEIAKLKNGDIAYVSDPPKLYEAKEKLYRYERVYDEPGKVVAIDKVLEIVKQKWTECDFRYGELNEIRAAMNTAKDIYEAIEALKGEQEQDEST